MRRSARAYGRRERLLTVTSVFASDLYSLLGGAFHRRQVGESGALVRQAHAKYSPEPAARDAGVPVNRPGRRERRTVQERPLELSAKVSAPAWPRAQTDGRG